MSLPGFTAARALDVRAAASASYLRGADAGEASDALVPQLTCICAPIGRFGRKYCICCHYNRTTGQTICYEEIADTA
ncbi:MAG TPA: hypothetical protein VEC06_11255 [Paucimonas sp.]|nr:hypothetical protein [Paucimonas sp.]